jgi:predicted transcriptional regulator
MAEKRKKEDLCLLGQKIRDLLEEQGKTDTWLARKADISNMTLYNILDGVTKSPGVLNIISIAEALKVKPCELLHVIMSIGACDELEPGESHIDLANHPPKECDTGEKKSEPLKAILADDEDKAAMVMFRTLVRKLLASLEV